MSVSKILGEDWSDYESRKTSKDKNLVDATEPWETIYLKNKINWLRRKEQEELKKLLELWAQFTY